jgi:hypothetical protein
MSFSTTSAEIYRTTVGTMKAASSSLSVSSVPRDAGNRRLAPWKPSRDRRSERFCAAQRLEPVSRSCCVFDTLHAVRPSMFASFEDAMYDIYVNDRNGLLVVPRGARFPSEEKGTWRKKRAVRSVSDRISDDILRRGYHLRNLSDRPITTYPRAAE